ncbi:MAG: hypothetical protein ACRCTE_05265 [Cellulosilyticaceae bacterium]
MFDAEAFIQSLFEDTTQSTLLFELIEGVSFLLPHIYDDLVATLPDDVASLCTNLEESCILSPIFIESAFHNNQFTLSFELPCELGIRVKNKTIGALHVSLTADAHFILRVEGGSKMITAQSPPSDYDSYSPDYLEFSHLTIDHETAQYIPSPPQKTWWPFK